MSLPLKFYSNLCFLELWMDLSWNLNILFSSFRESFHDSLSLSWKSWNLNCWELLKLLKFFKLLSQNTRNGRNARLYNLATVEFFAFLWYLHSNTWRWILWRDIVIFCSLSWHDIVESFRYFSDTFLLLQFFTDTFSSQFL